MAQTAFAVADASRPPGHAHTNFIRKLFGRGSNGAATASPPATVPREAATDCDTPAPDALRRSVREVVPGLPRVQTFKRQQSEKRTNLAPVEPTHDERRAVSVDRRVHQARTASQPPSQQRCLTRTSAPDLAHAGAHPARVSSPSVAGKDSFSEQGEYSIAAASLPEPEAPQQGRPEAHGRGGAFDTLDSLDALDTRSITTSQLDDMIHDELERKWILNLSMHFRDKSKREKFFVTFREDHQTWRRVTVSIDYRNAPEGSLELELSATKFQRDKSARIYEAIRDSLQDIQFYDTVTNLKLQTTEGRLHVHVVEDTNEIIHYPPVRHVQHMGCRRIREGDIVFDAHMSGFVYRVQVDGQLLIKKEIPGPETVDEFLYEINALHSLRHSEDVISFYGVVVDDHDEKVKGLLISYADQGALVDVLYDNCQNSATGTPWPERERWARQIVQGLAEIHECGFVQGDFTLSNIVVDQRGDAKIIDINRRGCPVGWEPPEATSLIQSGQRLSMYIGVKSDLFQLGMVLWALATQEDEPEIHGRPLQIGHDVRVPDWFRRVVETCLSENPRQRLQASSLLSLFPDDSLRVVADAGDPASISVDDGYSLQEYLVEKRNSTGHAIVKAVHSPSDWSYVNLTHAPSYAQDPYYFSRGRSPPSPLSSHQGHYGGDSKDRGIASWARAASDMPHSYSDAGPEESEGPYGLEGAAVYAAPPGPLEEAPCATIGTVLPRQSGALTPESLAVEHHAWVANGNAETPRPRPLDSHTGQRPATHDLSVPPLGDAAMEPAMIPLPLSPPVQGSDSNQTADAKHEHVLLRPLPNDLPSLVQECASPMLEAGGEVIEAEPRQEQQQQQKQQREEEEKERQSYPKPVQGVTASELEDTSEEFPMSEGSDSTPRPSEIAEVRADLGVLLAQAPGEAGAFAPAPAELEGVGAAHGHVARPWSTALTDDDFQGCTATTTTTTTTTATTEEKAGREERRENAATTTDR